MRKRPRLHRCCSGSSFHYGVCDAIDAAPIRRPDAGVDVDAGTAADAAGGVAGCLKWRLKWRLPLLDDALRLLQADHANLERLDHAGLDANERLKPTWMFRATKWP